MKRNKLLLCDTNEEYLCRLDSYIRENMHVAFELYDFTEKEALCSFDKKEETAVLVISQTAYEAEEKLDFENIIILDESDDSFSKEAPLEDENRSIHHISKFNPASEILKEIEEFGRSSYDKTNQRNDHKTSIIGFFTPITRCLQTTTALTLGQILAKNKNTLYLNFEAFSSVTIKNDNTERFNLSDLLYFNEFEECSFKEKLDKAVVKMGNLNMIDSIPSLLQLQKIPSEKLLQFINKLASEFEYDYIILDLSNSQRDIPEILEACDSIFSIRRKDKTSLQRQRNYEKMLVSNNYESILDKTHWKELPLLKKLPSDVSRYCFGELSDYVSENIKEYD